MSNETKRDVFDEAVNELEDVLPDTAIFGNEYIADIVGELRARYAAALPDDLPVIPKAVADYMKDYKNQINLSFHSALYEAFDDLFAASQDVEHWIEHNSDVFARAWLDGYVVEVEK